MKRLRKGKKKEEKAFLYFYHKNALFLRCRLVLRTRQEGVLLLLNTSLFSLPGGLGPCPLGVHLLLKYAFALLLSLGLVDLFSSSVWGYRLE